MVPKWLKNPTISFSFSCVRCAGICRALRQSLKSTTGVSIRIDRRFDDFHLLVNHALGLGTMNQHKARELEARHDLADAWQRRTEERFDQIERRLAKVEEKSDT